jgi:8-oxo-dGTP diphosphatase
MGKDISPGTQYVCGFLFDSIDHPFGRVLLIKKLRPDYQAGWLNGVGGKMQHGEQPVQAMIREFKQETGLLITDWIYFCQMRYINKATIHFFYAQGDIDSARSQTDEELQIMGVSSMLNVWCIVPDLRWLVPMALRMKEEPCKYLEVVKVGLAHD